jgi:hypothetical protein
LYDTDTPAATAGGDHLMLLPLPPPLLVMIEVITSLMLPPPQLVMLEVIILLLHKSCIPSQHPLCFIFLVGIDIPSFSGL